jgi:hypothetical protein
VAISAVVVPDGSSGVAALSGVRPSSANRRPCRAASARAERAAYSRTLCERPFTPRMRPFTRDHHRQPARIRIVQH